LVYFFGAIAMSSSDPLDVSRTKVTANGNQEGSQDLFAAYQVKLENDELHIPAFFIESTAPDNLDDKTKPLEEPPSCERLPSVQAAIDRIVGQLAQQEEPKLVFTVHGFNSPRTAVLQSFTRSFLSVNNDTAIRKRGVVCVGYRWPSERMLRPFWSGYSAAPFFLIGMVFVALGIAGLVNFEFNLYAIPFWWRILITAVIALMAGIPITLFLLRLIVYFRDQYRALTYGVPDLVDIIRLIDAALETAFKDAGHAGTRADLSFIGHSMGGFVVTNTVRILSDVFSPFSPPPKTEAKGTSLQEQAKDLDKRSEIGKAFRLRRLVLVSPDIPAEVLMSGRANALRSSVERFEEAHLFSNEADEVLRNISTTANFFMLPTKRRMFGYRLGNVGVLTPSYGITKGLTDPRGHVALDKLQVGYKSLADLYTRLGSDQFQAGTAQRFTYFDCTNSISDAGIGVVSAAKRGKPTDLSSIGHLVLLARYVAGGPDVHSGYFADNFVGSLIYRFACIGYGDSEQAYNGFEVFSAACKDHQIKALRN
jgi:pimeloyl-ACP methyl ester carboxylesterase